MPQENERALGGWQAEWPSLAGLLEAFGSAVEGIAEVAPDLTRVQRAHAEEPRRDNGAVLAERATFLLGERMGKTRPARSSRRRWRRGQLRRGARPTEERVVRSEGNSRLLAQVRRSAVGRSQAAMTLLFLGGNTERGMRAWMPWRAVHHCVTVKSARHAHQRIGRSSRLVPLRSVRRRSISSDGLAHGDVQVLVEAVHHPFVRRLDQRRGKWKSRRIVWSSSRRARPRWRCRSAPRRPGRCAGRRPRTYRRRSAPDRRRSNPRRCASCRCCRHACRAGSC